MDDLPGVRRGQRARDLREQVQQQRHGHRPALAHQVVESLPLEELHDEVDAARGVAIIVDADDVRVVDQVDGLGLVQEPRDACSFVANSGRSSLIAVRRFSTSWVAS